MVAGVGDVQALIVRGHPLRVVERRLGGGAVVRPRAALADDGLDPSVEIGDDETVMAAVGDEQAILRDVDLAGETQERPVGVRIRRDIQRAGGEDPLVAPLGQERVDLPGESRLVDLSGDGVAHVPAGVDQNERRPGAHREAFPDVVLRVDHDGMGDSVALDRAPHVLRVFLRDELGRVDADDDDRVLREALFDAAQDRQDVHAVDAAVGPEVEDRHPPAQIPGHAQRPARVDPGEPGQKFGAAHAGCRHPGNLYPGRGKGKGICGPGRG